MTSGQIRTFPVSATGCESNINGDAPMPVRHNALVVETSAPKPLYVSAPMFSASLARDSVSRTPKSSMPPGVLVPGDICSGRRDTGPTGWVGLTTSGGATLRSNE